MIRNPAREQERARHRREVLRRLRWAYPAGLRRPELARRLGWPGGEIGLLSVLRDLAERGEAVERGDEWFLAAPPTRDLPAPASSSRGAASPPGGAPAQIDASPVAAPEPPPARLPQRPPEASGVTTREVRVELGRHPDGISAAALTRALDLGPGSYHLVTDRLRALEAAGVAERTGANNRTRRWRLVRVALPVSTPPVEPAAGDPADDLRAAVGALCAPDGRCLGVLCAHPDGLAVVTVAEQLGASPSQVRASLRRLAEVGLAHPQGRTRARRWLATRPAASLQILTPDPEVHHARDR